MADRANLIVLSVIAAAMAVYVVLDSGAPGGEVREPTRLVPEQRAGTLEKVTFRRPGQQPVVLERDAETGAYEMTGPAPAPLDDRAMADFAGTLELLSYRRAVDPDDAGDTGLSEPRLMLELAYQSGAEVELRLGDYLDPTDQFWLAREGRDRIFLIDGYEGRALDRRPAELRSRRPLPTRNRDITGVEIDAGDAQLVLSGRPLEVHLDGGGTARMDPDARDALLERIDALRLTRFADAPDDSGGSAGSIRPSIRVIGGDGTRELVDLGPCPRGEDERLVDTPTGTGCVREEALAEIALAPRLAGQLIDRHLVSQRAGKPTAIAIEAGGERQSLTAAGAGWRDGGGNPADPRAVLEWAQAIDALPGEPHRRVEGDPRVVAGVEFTYDGGRTDRVELLESDGELLVRRAGEPIAFPAPPEARALVAPSDTRFRDRAIWSYDPTEIRELTRRRAGRIDTHLERGQLLTDWTVHAPSGQSVDTARIDGVLESAARLRAARFTDRDQLTPAATVEITFAPLSSDQPITERIEISRDCRARIPGDPAIFELTQDSCDHLLGAWTD